MFRLIEGIIEDSAIEQLKNIAQAAPFVDGKISNPHSKVKNNLQLHDPDAQRKSVEIMASALIASEDFRNFALPAQIAPPLLAKYEPGMNYGLHPDAAIMQLHQGVIRSDLSCTMFLEDPEEYDGGALRIQLGTEEVRIKGPKGSAIVYPSHTLHEVEEVTRGQRLVGLTFIQSQVSNSSHREMLYELGEIAALEGNSMSHENFTRLQAVQFNLQRMWSKP